MDTSKEEVVEVVDDRDTSDHELQADYVKREEQSSSGIGIVYTEQFLKSMRSLGYKSAAYALSEQVDNSIQGGADLIDIRFGGFDRPVGDGKKRNNAIPSQIAVVDNGIGIIPEMIPYTLRWGGTHRHDNREGMGRFGFGLPSSSLHLGTCYTVYSKIASGTWHASTFDLNEVAKTGGDAKALDKLIEPRPANPPEWAVEPAGDDKNDGSFADMQSGTVIVHERVDNLDYKTLNKNRDAFYDHFGLVYRKLINGRKIMLDGTFVSPIDPLFLTPDARLYHAPGYSGKAELVRDDVTMVKGDDGKYYPVRVRAAYLEPMFAYSDEARASWLPGLDRRNLRSFQWQERDRVMRNTNGYLMMRSGRLIDITTGDGAWQNNDRNLKIEIDIDPSLDSFYQITTSKQQVTLSDRAKDVFLEGRGKHNLGLSLLRVELRRRWKRDNDVEDNLRPTDARDKAVEQVLSILPNLEAIDTRTASTKTEALAVDEEKKEIENRRRKTNESEEEAAEQIREETQLNPFEVEWISHGEAPFFTPSRVGQKKKLTIDTLHPWYTKVFATSPDQDAWLHFLWILSKSELDSKDPTYQGKDISWLYRHERRHWSWLLAESLDALRSDASIEDRVNATEAAGEMPDDVEETATSKE